MPAKDLQLTAVTALFIASKNLEVDPLELRVCVQTMCFNKYAKSAFVEKETLIRQSCDYENEAPSTLDFILLYLRLLKVRVQEQVMLGEQAVRFLDEV